MLSAKTAKLLVEQPIKSFMPDYTFLSFSRTFTVGSPICAPKMAHPTETDVDFFHHKYIDAITELFYAHKDEYAEPNAKLIIN